MTSEDFNQILYMSSSTQTTKSAGVMLGRDRYDMEWPGSSFRSNGPLELYQIYLLWNIPGIVSTFYCLLRSQYHFVLLPFHCELVVQIQTPFPSLHARVALVLFASLTFRIEPNLRLKVWLSSPSHAAVRRQEAWSCFLNIRAVVRPQKRWSCFPNFYGEVRCQDASTCAPNFNASQSERNSKLEMCA